MNKIITLSLLLLFIAPAVKADNTKFVQVMEKTIAMMDTAEHIASFQKIANKFERIGEAESEEWLPKYWAAQSYIFMSYMEKDKKVIDQLLDKAEKLVEAAQEIKKDESELYVLQGWIYSARIGVDPMTRGMKYGPLSDKTQQKAKELNPENPRPYYMLGTGKFYTPAMWGGGKDKAKPLLETAMEKYESFKPESTIHPNWGKEQAAKMLEDCNAEE